MEVANIPDQYRRQGTTTKQMRGAPHGALYIWPVADLSYPKFLVRFIDRPDLIIAGPQALEDGRRLWAGHRLPVIIFDHACALSASDWEAYRNIEARCVR